MNKLARWLRKLHSKAGKSRPQRRTPMPRQLLYKIPEVCAITGLGRSTIYTLLDQPGGLETVRIGRAVRIPASVVERWVQELTP